MRVAVIGLDNTGKTSLIDALCEYDTELFCPHKELPELPDDTYAGRIRQILNMENSGLMDLLPDLFTMNRIIMAGEIDTSDRSKIHLFDRSELCTEVYATVPVTPALAKIHAEKVKKPDVVIYMSCNMSTLLEKYKMEKYDIFTATSGKLQCRMDTYDRLLDELPRTTKIIHIKNYDYDIAKLAQELKSLRAM